MKDSRKGECLWSEWTGIGAEALLPASSLVFFTEDHVELENEIVLRALASALQHDGSAVSLGDGYKMAEKGNVFHVSAGEVDNDTELTICNSDGETRDGDKVDRIVEITLVAL
jgi:hypothetical protein